MQDGFSQSVRTEDRATARSILNSIDWTQEAIDSLQSVYLESPHLSVCFSDVSDKKHIMY